MKKIHSAILDPEPSVRWAAIDLMYRIHDPEVVPSLEKMLSLDTDPEIRKRALKLIEDATRKGTAQKPALLKDLLAALDDTDKDVRMTALLGLGETGDLRVVPKIAELLNDADTQVRLQALHTLSQIQEHRNSAFVQLDRQLQDDYETAVRHAKDRAKEAR